MLKRFHNEQGGFTLIELLVVVAILGVLATIAVPRVIDAIDTARENKGVADLKVIQSALDRYYFDNSLYPEKLNDLKGTYIKNDFEFTNAFDKYYFYAICYDDTGTLPGHLKEYVLGDPGQTPAVDGSGDPDYTALYNTATGDPMPEGDPSAVYYWGTDSTTGTSRIEIDGGAGGEPTHPDLLKE